jgi:hypothetical protein
MKIIEIIHLDRIEYRLDSCTGPLHNENDMPAIRYNNGSKLWYAFGKLHREHAPAAISVFFTGTSEEWYKEGLKHRIGYPSFKSSDGAEEWCVEGRRHRLDGPAVIYRDGTKEWYKNSLFHREDGPAIIKPNGNREWRVNGVLHRIDGPALIWNNGRSEDWFINGIIIKRSDAKIAKEIISTMPIDNTMLYIGDPVLCYFVKYRLEVLNTKKYI